MITTLKDLKYLADNKISVVTLNYMFKKPVPAAFVINLQGHILLRLFDTGLYAYISLKGGSNEYHKKLGILGKINQMPLSGIHCQKAGRIKHL